MTQTYKQRNEQLVRELEALKGYRSMYMHLIDETEKLRSILNSIETNDVERFSLLLKEYNRYYRKGIK